MIWNRQPCDTDKSWEAFVRFRDQKPPRRLIRPGGGATAELSTWYREHNWRERVTAYDSHMDEILITEREALLKDSTRTAMAEHISLLNDSRQIAAQELAKLLETSSASPAGGLLKPNELIKLIDATIKLDRLVRGESTEIVEERTDLSQISVEDLRKLKEIKEKLRKS